MEDDKKLAWVVDKDGNVHANSETLLLREVDGLMRDEDVSSSLLSSFENAFLILSLRLVMFRRMSIGTCCV